MRHEPKLHTTVFPICGDYRQYIILISLLRLHLELGPLVPWRLAVFHCEANFPAFVLQKRCRFHKVRFFCYENINISVVPEKLSYHSNYAYAAIYPILDPPLSSSGSKTPNTG